MAIFPLLFKKHFIKAVSQILLVRSDLCSVKNTRNKSWCLASGTTICILVLSSCLQIGWFKFYQSVLLSCNWTFSSLTFDEGSLDQLSNLLSLSILHDCYVLPKDIDCFTILQVFISTFLNSILTLSIPSRLKYKFTCIVILQATKIADSAIKSIQTVSLKSFYYRVLKLPIHL